MTSLKMYILFKLYLMGLIRRETPFELFEEPAKPGFYIWCSRDYCRLSFKWIRKS